MDTISFIRTNHGRMSEERMRTALGLNPANFRDAKAEALWGHLEKPEMAGEIPPVKRRRRRTKRSLWPSEIVLRAALMLCQSTIDEIKACRSDQRFAARDFICWALKSRAGISDGSIGHMVGLNAYGARLAYLRHARRVDAPADKAASGWAGALLGAIEEIERQAEAVQWKK